MREWRSFSRPSNALKSLQHIPLRLRWIAFAGMCVLIAGIAIAIALRSSASHDEWTAEDLYAIGQAAAQNGSSLSSGLAGLHIHGLHYPPSDYTYTEGGAAVGGSSPSYTICAHFDTSTIPKNTANLVGTSNNSVNVYTTHRKGTQCWNNNLGPYSGVSIVLDGNETLPPPKIATENITGAQLVALFNGYYTAQTQALGIGMTPSYKYCILSDAVSEAGKPVYECLVNTDSPSTGNKQTGGITSDSAAGEAIMKRYVAVANQEGFYGQPDPILNADNLSNKTEPFFTYEGSMYNKGGAHDCSVQASYYPRWENQNVTFLLDCAAYLIVIPPGFTKADSNL